MTLKTGPLAQKLMHHFEGMRLKAYKCPAGVWTIGLGDTGPHVKPGLVWTREQAEEAFERRLAREFEPGVRATIGDAGTTPAQFGSMVALAYNIGVGRFRTSSVAKNHVAGNHAAAAASFGLFNKARVRGVLQPVAGLTRRREAEAALYRGDLDTVRRMIGLPS